jgi:hypothetical protein
MLWTRADGATRPQHLGVERTTFLLLTSFMPNGRRLLFDRLVGLPQAWSVDVGEDGGSLKAGQPAPWLTGRSIDVGAAFSQMDDGLPITRRNRAYGKCT